MPAFHRLRVADVRRETADTVSVAFDVPAELHREFAFVPGQHVTVRVPGPDGDEVRRSYSICSGLDDGELRIAVKRIDGGVFGVHACDRLRPGDELDVMTPVGRFTLSPDATTAGAYLGIAAGSGITPVLSLLRSSLAREPGCQWTLVYGNRGPATTIFREALADLKDRYLDRLSVVHVFSREHTDVPLLHGRLDAEKLRALAGRLLDVPSYDGIFVCGPQQMAEVVRSTLVELGAAEERVHVELFGTELPALPRPAPSERDAEGARLQVTLAGLTTTVAAAPGATVLEAARAGGLDVPFSCTAGVCSTCRARVVDGAVEMAVNYALEPWETAAGFVLTCQSRPTTAQVAVDYDAV